MPRQVGSVLSAGPCTACVHRQAANRGKLVLEAPSRPQKVVRTFKGRCMMHADSGLLAEEPCGPCGSGAIDRI